jgi:hypothetical protein
MAVAGAALFATCASAAASFLSVSATAYVWSYSNQLDVTTSAWYSDYSCTPTYSCDKNVNVEVVLHRGYSTYSPVVARKYGETGQYGSTVRTSFRLPNCKYIPRMSSQHYAVEINASAPDGSEQSTTRLVTQSSCAR